MRRPFVLPFLLAALVAFAPACRTANRATGDGDAGPAARPLAPLVVRDESTGLTFSYITLDGGFQLVKKVGDVPYEARDAVRVWSEESGDGISGTQVYLADLRTKQPDGTYRVEIVSRAVFEDLAAARRAKTGAAASQPPPPAGEKTAKAGGSGSEKGAFKVIIYGADWCKPCKMAENYLKSKGIAFEHRDVDDPNVNEEMLDKLQGAGIKGGRIPVFDVGGKLIVGFSESELDAAIKAARP